MRMNLPQVFFSRASRACVECKWDFTKFSRPSLLIRWLLPVLMDQFTVPSAVVAFISFPTKTSSGPQSNDYKRLHIYCYYVVDGSSCNYSSMPPPPPSSTVALQVWKGAMAGRETRLTVFIIAVIIHSGKSRTTFRLMIQVSQLNFTVYLYRVKSVDSNAWCIHFAWYDVILLTCAATYEIRRLQILIGLVCTRAASWKA